MNRDEIPYCVQVIKNKRCRRPGNNYLLLSHLTGTPSTPAGTSLF